MLICNQYGEIVHFVRTSYATRLLVNTDNGMNKKGVYPSSSSAYTHVTQWTICLN